MTNETLRLALDALEEVDGAVLGILGLIVSQPGKDSPADKVRSAIIALHSAIDAEQAKGREAVATGTKFFNYGVDSGFETHETAEQAKTAAENDLQCYRDEAGEGWAEEAERVCWGVILSETVEVDLGPAPEGSGFDKWIDYQLTTPPAQPAREWVGLTDEEIEKGRDQTFSINNPFCPCDSKTMRKAARWAEAKLREKNAGQPVAKEN